MIEVDDASPTATWEAVLDSLERSLQEAAAVVRRPGGDPADEPTGWFPPEVDGPLPRHLVPRVSHLLREFEQVQLEISQAMGARRAELSTLSRTAGGVGRPIAAYVDISA
ncbi:hypothetical protein EUA93_07660 [Nocardioides oleivorans]|uniref:Uncharacterized protein n=1 Tax=Nocardioides oleivorans TaxID=273676 RepID=A0A4Q2RYH6_9ACTN|nr:hypothetical protein [Nocardioides oleivorans]RYB94227.1 hypothetical protein EUA93_07660 [Nocardioides oleivorans]